MSGNYNGQKQMCDRHSSNFFLVSPEISNQALNQESLNQAHEKKLSLTIKFWLFGVVIKRNDWWIYRALKYHNQESLNQAHDEALSLKNRFDCLVS